MDIFRIAVFAVLAVSIILLVRHYRPEISLQITVIAGLVMFLFMMGTIEPVVESIRLLASRFHIETEYIGILLKIIGIAYIAQFAAEICKDAGESAIASKVELGGRIMILTAAFPAVVSLLELATSLLNVSDMP